MPRLTLKIILTLIFFGLNLGLWQTNARAYHYFLPPIVTDDTVPIPAGDTAVCSITFRRAGNLILIPAKADTVSGDFILDTGAPHLVLNNTYFRDHKVIDTTHSGGINGGIASVGQTVIDQFSIGTFKYRRVGADMISLTHIENLKGRKILGLIGLNLLTNYTITIDYQKNIIKFRMLKGRDGFSFCKRACTKAKPWQTLKFKLVEDKIITIGVMSGEKLNFIVDTGAETNILDSRLPNPVLEKITIKSRVNLGGSDANKVEAINGEAEEIKLGSMTVKKLPVTITNLSNMCNAYNFCIHGMLGYSFLSLHQVEFNFAKGEIYLWD